VPKRIRIRRLSVLVVGTRWIADGCTLRHWFNISSIKLAKVASPIDGGHDSSVQIGSGTRLWAPAAVGSPITLDAGNFSYRIVPDDPIHNTFVNDCQAVAEPAVLEPPTLAVIPIVRIPTSKDDCKHGGWRSFTDDEGTPFRNQGECIRFVQ
jgi:hypothetical protein